MVLNGLNLAHSTKFGASCLVQRLLPLGQAAVALFLLSARSAQSVQTGRTDPLGSVQPLGDPTAAPSWRESGQRSSRPLATALSRKQSSQAAVQALSVSRTRPVQRPGCSRYVRVVNSSSADELFTHALREHERPFPGLFQYEQVRPSSDGLT